MRESDILNQWFDVLHKCPLIQKAEPWWDDTYDTATIAYINRTAWTGSSTSKNEFDAIIMEEEIQQLWSDLDDDADGSGKRISRRNFLFVVLESLEELDIEKGASAGAITLGKMGWIYTTRF